MARDNRTGHQVLIDLIDGDGVGESLSFKVPDLQIDVMAVGRCRHALAPDSPSGDLLPGDTSLQLAILRRRHLHGFEIQILDGLLAL